ncbi:MAG TPA: hypothetical protein VKT51_03935 [Candidatus Eremiobacteraceae bacterium]|nr:hypothetical protein [Candidatus Eremiobacteraceae bacterium]
MLFRRLIPIAALLVVSISGCSSRGAVPAPTAQGVSEFVQPDAIGSWLYACAPKSNACDAFKVSGTKLTYAKTITTLMSIPEGGVATVAGNWYQTEQAAADIQIFASHSTGPTGPIGTLADANARPLDVAIDASAKLVAVSDVFAGSGGPGDLAIYKNGASTPASRLTFTIAGGSVAGFGAAIDHSGDCFWSINDLHNIIGDIVEFKKCAGKGTIVASTAKFDAMGGLTFDKSGNLFYVDQFKGVMKCAGIKNCKLLKGGLNSPAYIRFDSGWKHLWLTDNGAGTIIALNPATGAAESTTPAHTGPYSGLSLAPGPLY